jgi:hypothetical protein
MCDYPRVVVLTQNKIQPFTGGGVVLSNLFYGFPPENLIFLHRDRQYKDSSRYEEYRLTWPWLRVRINALARHLGIWALGVIREPRKARISDIVSLLKASSYFRVPRSIDQRIREFRPEIIYAWTSDSLWARTLRDAAMRYDTPYVIHFMDNHFEVQPTTPLQRALLLLFRQELASVACDAAALFTISDSMGQAYSGYWNRPYEVYRGAIETSKWPWPNLAEGEPDGTFRLAFAGSTDQSQLSGLSEVAKALDTLIQKGERVELVLYLTEHYACAARPILGRYRCVAIRPHPDTASLRAALGSADALVLAYSFDEVAVQYYRYSFATKIVPYMLSCRPILIYGPEGIEPVRYAVRGRWALVVARPKHDALVTAIMHLMNDGTSRASLAKAAWRAAQHEHDQHSQAARFGSSLLRLSHTRHA